MNTEHELFGELHEQEENGLFGNEHRRQSEAQQEALRLSDVMRSCVHCGNTERFETWTELEYNDGSAEPHTAGNYLVNVEYVKCLDCGEVL